MINTGTTIVTFLMVFLIQNTQNRDSVAMQIKLDELLRAVKGAQTAMADLEDLTEAELDAFKAHYAELAAAAREKMRREGGLPFGREAAGAGEKRKGNGRERPSGLGGQRQAAGWGWRPTNASTASGSSWVPATRRSSAMAASGGRESR